MYRGLTGYCLVYRALGVNTMSIVEQQQLKAGEKPASQQNSPTGIAAPTEKPGNTVAPDDEVDENLWETFPASDPPATY